MWNSLRNTVVRLLHGNPAGDDYREKLAEARTKLDEEAAAMQRDLGKVHDRSPDPIATIITNIRRVRGRQ